MAMIPMEYDGGLILHCDEVTGNTTAAGNINVQNTTRKNIVAALCVDPPSNSPYYVMGIYSNTSYNSTYAHIVNGSGSPVGSTSVTLKVYYTE